MAPVENRLLDVSAPVSSSCCLAPGIGCVSLYACRVEADPAFQFWSLAEFCLLQLQLWLLQLLQLLRQGVVSRLGVQTQHLACCTWNLIRMSNSAALLPWLFFFEKWPPCQNAISTPSRACVMISAVLSKGC